MDVFTTLETVSVMVPANDSLSDVDTVIERACFRLAIIAVASTEFENVMMETRIAFGGEDYSSI